jgi:hypothetical protein
MTNTYAQGLPVGSWLYRNWQAAIAGAPELLAEELPLFSDARFTGHILEGLGPYQVLNAFGYPHEPGTLAPSLVLRQGAHLNDEIEAVAAAFRTGKGDVASFVGGPAQEEFAALLALSHTARLAAGEVTRWFRPEDTDPRGTPVQMSGASPILVTRGRRTPLPTLARRIALSPDLLRTYTTLEWSTARELARAARSYRLAVWEAEADPNFAWLLLVSAVEAAANEWARLQNLPVSSPAELLMAMRPDFVDRLRQAAGTNADAVLTEVGTSLNDVLRAQWKFRTFLLTYGLQAPQPRPQAWPLDWTEEGLKKRIEQVYTYRSKALHASIPFPPPMCEAPFPSDDGAGNRAWSERPSGSTFHLGGLWTESDLPMNLHAFHHLTSVSICRWWKEVAGV